jgi:4-hydroxybutyryl-CoA dehydratase/vinylacetyl-CoA-Delta-isomerase
MNSADYRESLRRHSPRVFVDGARIDSVVDAPALQPGINALGLTYDFALRDELAPIMRAVQASSGKTVNRMLHVDQSSADLLNKLEAVRVLCQETGCAQRYLAHDAFSALAESTARIDADHGTRYGERFTAYLHDFQDKDLSVGIAMTDAKGDRSKRPHEQANADSYVHIVERTPRASSSRGPKAIVTGAPYVHEFLVMPCRNMSEADAAFAVCCAVPCDADGVTDRRAAGRDGRARRRRCSRTSTASRPGSSSSTASSSPGSASSSPASGSIRRKLTYSYATHHRHTCIAARAGFGDLLIGAGALMCEANGFDPGQETHLREQMVQLITIVEGFYACGVAASVYASADSLSKTVTPDPVFANIGKLLLANQIYEMHRIAHYVSGGLIVTLPGPDEDHNPETSAQLADVLRANPAVPYDKRIEAARLIEDLTASYQGGWYSVISLHGGGSPEAMKQEIWRNYPVGNKVELVERLLERNVLAEPGRKIGAVRQPGKCCDAGCTPPSPTTMVALPGRRPGETST